MTELRLGVWTPLPHVIPPEPGMAIAIAEVAETGAHGPDLGLAFATEVVVTAERLGFDLTLIAQRYMGPDHEAWIMATALACATQTMEIMVAVHPGLVSPQIVAKMGATLDRISGGRFSMNVVNGWWAEEMNMFGGGAWLPSSADRYLRMSEFVEVVRKLWTEDGPRFEGSFFSLHGRDLPMRTVQSPCPLIYAASRAVEGKSIVARHCDCWFVDYDPELSRYEQNLERIIREIGEMRASAAGHGRLLSFGLSAHVICADSEEEAAEEAAALLRYGARDRIALIAAKALGAGLVGTAATVAARLDAYVEAGVECVMLRWHPMLAGLERFGAEVMPLLKTPIRRPSRGSGPGVSARGR